MQNQKIANYYFFNPCLADFPIYATFQNPRLSEISNFQAFPAFRPHSSTQNPDLSILNLLLLKLAAILRVNLYRMKQKLLLLSLLIFCFSFCTLAQPGKGQFYLGGSMNYNYNTYGSKTTYNFSTGYTDYFLTNISAFSISPEFGYFLSDEWSVGIQPTYQRNSGTESSYFYSYISPSDNYVSSDNYHTNIAGIGITIRYYAMITDKFGFFPQLGISTLNNTSKFSYGTFNIAAVPNFVFFATPQLGVNLGFGNLSYNLDYETKNHSFNAGLNNTITFGLNYLW